MADEVPADRPAAQRRVDLLAAATAVFALLRALGVKPPRAVRELLGNRL